MTLEERRAFFAYLLAFLRSALGTTSIQPRSGVVVVDVEFEAVGCWREEEAREDEEEEEAKGAEEV